MLYMKTKKYSDYIDDPTISEAQRAKEIEYKNYVDNHIKNVKKAFELLSKLPEFYNIIKKYKSGSPQIYVYQLESIIKNHDMSKYYDPEWEAYRRYFYPVNDDEKKAAENDFNIAWKHHYENNHHHWDYWYHSNSVNKMTFSNVIEECCDWIAMSMAFPGTALEFYKKKCVFSDDIKLGDLQKQITEEVLTLFYKHYTRLGESIN